MTSWWPWLAVAGLGALHGLSPANGWMFAAACGWHERNEQQALRALLPIALGHGASVALVVLAVSRGVWVNRSMLQWLAGALLISVAAYRVTRPKAQRTSTSLSLSGSHTGLALWSCLMTSAHGAGLMLVPALTPLCMSGTPARAITASGSIWLGLGAVMVHLAVMLMTTAVISTGVVRGVARLSPHLNAAAMRHAWTATLLVSGGLLLALH